MLPKFRLNRFRLKRSSRTKSKRKVSLIRLLKPVGRVAAILDRLRLQFILNFLVAQFIPLYQKYLSPLKGFSCAYSKLHRADSCSEHFRTLVKHHGLAKAIPLFEQRLQDCKSANMTLKAYAMNRRNTG
jgi:putative component of membrane protein insertase Oxa1/YidC/SpoIIIJ protein YidD